MPSMAAAGDLPPGFHERTVLEGLNLPVRALVRCSAACTLRLKLIAEGRTARELGLSGKVGGARAPLEAGADTWVRAELARRARRQLREDPEQRVPWIVPRFAANPR